MFVRFAFVYSWSYVLQLVYLLGSWGRLRVAVFWNCRLPPAFLCGVLVRPRSINCNKSRFNKLSQCIFAECELYLMTLQKIQYRLEVFAWDLSLEILSLRIFRLRIACCTSLYEGLHFKRQEPLEAPQANECVHDALAGLGIWKRPRLVSSSCWGDRWLCVHRSFLLGRFFRSWVWKFLIELS